MKNIKIYDDMTLTSWDKKLEGTIRYWNYDEINKGAIISISGEFRDGMEIAKFILPSLAENTAFFIIDFSNFKYTGGDDFFNWYYFLKDFYSDISLIESDNGFPNRLSTLFPKDNIVLVYSALCKSAIVSLIEDEDLVELNNKCFNSVNNALDFIVRGSLNIENYTKEIP